MKTAASKKRKPKWFYCETWKMNYYFLIGWPQKYTEKYVLDNLNHRTNLEQSDGHSWLATTKDYQGIYIWVRDKNEYSMLAHECTHAACWTLDERKWKPDFTNEEPLAYLVERIFREAIS